MRRGGHPGPAKKEMPEVLRGSVPPGLVLVPALAASASPGNGRGGHVLEIPTTLASMVLSGKAQAWMLPLPLPLATFGVSPPAPWPCRGVLRMRGAVWHPRVPGPYDKSLP